MSPETSYTDYYEILQISPNAQAETIQRVYRLLAQHYHPDNKETGNVEQFNLVLEAYRVLNDPERRASYDVEHKTVKGLKWKIFDQSSSVQGVDAERRKRLGILSLLCTKRINDPHHPSLTVFELEDLLGCPREHLELSLWYLKESGRITRADNGRYQLTAKGLETLEDSADSSAKSVRLLAPAFQATTY
jgi:curved DNA-binding protein CbpA